MGRRELFLFFRDCPHTPLPRYLFSDEGVNEVIVGAEDYFSFLLDTSDGKVGTGLWGGGGGEREMSEPMRERRVTSRGWSRVERGTMEKRERIHICCPPELSSPAGPGPPCPRRW